MLNDTSAHDTLWKLIKDMRFGMLTHRTATGMLHAHPLTTMNKTLDRDSKLYFFISRDTELYSNLQRDGTVNVSYANPEADGSVRISVCEAVSEIGCWVNFILIQAPARPPEAPRLSPVSRVPPLSFCTPIGGLCESVFVQYCKLVHR